MIICDSAYLPFSRSCITDKDCPRVKNYTARCRKGYCQYFEYWEEGILALENELQFIHYARILEELPLSFYACTK